MTIPRWSALLLSLAGPHVAAWAAVPQTSASLQTHPCDGRAYADLTAAPPPVRLDWNRAGADATHEPTYELKVAPAASAVASVVVTDRTRAAQRFFDATPLSEHAADAAPAAGQAAGQADMGACITYTTQHDRATLTVQGQDAGGAPVGTHRTLVTGPDEHLSLSLDVPLTRPRMLKYEPATQSNVDVRSPVTGLLGINYKFGDVFTDDGLGRLGNTGVKAMFRLAPQMGRSYGVGAFYQVRWAQVFVAEIWTKGEDRAPLQRSPAVGLSLNFIDFESMFGAASGSVRRATLFGG